MATQKKCIILFLMLATTIMLGCQTPLHFTLPMTPSVSALAVESKSEAGQAALSREKEFITDAQTIRQMLVILEKYKDNSKLRTFDFADDHDYRLTWQIKETGKADRSQIYLSLKRPQQLVYSIEKVDNTRLTYVVTMSREDQKEFWTLLGITPS